MTELYLVMVNGSPFLPKGTEKPMVYSTEAAATRALEYLENYKDMHYFNGYFKEELKEAHVKVVRV